MSQGKRNPDKYLNREITSEEMKVIEEKAEKMGFDRRLMMENAGAGTSDFISSKIDVSGKIGLVVCGTGNNGGDGFVTARHLVNLGAKIKVMLIGNPTNIRTHESQTNWSLIDQMKDIEKITLIEASQISKFVELLKKCDFIVDAILGTGVKGTLRDPILSVVVSINKENKPIFDVDAPTGLDPSTGEICGEAVNADYTITFHRMKKGFRQREKYVGEVYVREIGIPSEAEVNEI
jgi:NAD(P)H-hydrate epimerase